MLIWMFLSIKSLIKGAWPLRARLFFFRDQQRRPPSIVLGCSDSHASGTLPLLGLRKCRNRFVTNHLRIRWDLHCANGGISVIQQEGYLPKRWFFPKIWMLIFFYKSYLKWRKKNLSFTQWSPLKWNPNDHRGHSERWKLASVWETSSKEEGHHVRRWDCISCVVIMCIFRKRKTTRLILWSIPQALYQKIPIGSVSFAQVPEGVLNTKHL